MIVYHKDSLPALTHCMRIASGDDIAGPENYTGSFYRSPLVGYYNWPSEAIFTAVTNNWPSDICPKWLDSEFGKALGSAMGDSVPGFDPNVD